MRPTSTLVYRVKKMAREGMTLEQIDEIEEASREQLRSVLNRSGIDYLFYCKEGQHNQPASKRQKGHQHCQDCHPEYEVRKASKPTQTWRDQPDVMELASKKSHHWGDDATRLIGELIHWGVQGGYQYEEH